MQKSILVSLSTLLFITLSAFTCACALELSADMITTGKGTQRYSSKTYIKGDKYRMEVSGQHQYTILRQDKNVMWIVMPDQKSFMEMPFDPKQRPKVEEKYTGEVSRKLIGSETIDGHPTQKYEVMIKEGTKTEKYYQWMATDIHFPIKVAAVDGSWSVEYRNIKKTVADSLFEIPAGYQKISLPAIPANRSGRMVPRNDKEKGESDDQE